jgi:hypothetical protein
LLPWRAAPTASLRFPGMLPIEWHLAIYSGYTGSERERGRTRYATGPEIEHLTGIT